MFAAVFEGGIFIGQIRTRLAVPGFEREGPMEAARALLEQISLG